MEEKPFKICKYCGLMTPGEDFPRVEITIGIGINPLKTIEIEMCSDCVPMIETLDGLELIASLLPSNWSRDEMIEWAEPKAYIS
tara:strand:+ start:1086 stop:1337 length:252 start_codon:yes stop_codon:yes gene_type:complete